MYCTSYDRSHDFVCGWAAVPNLPTVEGRSTMAPVLGAISGELSIALLTIVSDLDACGSTYVPGLYRPM
jgi:hypothetical protein